MANPWIDRRVLSFAHQGGALEAPSSTMFAMRKAVEARANVIELDLHSTADGELVCVHDETLDRTTNGSGYVREFTLEELKGLDAAFNFVEGSGEPAMVDRPSEEYTYRGRAPEDPEFTIPTLSEVMTQFPSTYLNLDLKDDLGDGGSMEYALGEALRASDRTERTIVASFLFEPLQRFREAFPEFATAATPEEALGFYQSFLNGERPDEVPFVALQIPASYGGIEYIDSRFVDFAHECGVALHVWTINEESQMEWLVEMGVDGVISDRPSVLGGVLERRGVAFHHESVA